MLSNCSMSSPRILVIRHARRRRLFYDVILDWVAEHFPRHRGLLDVWDLPDETARDFPWRLDLIAWRRLAAAAQRLTAAGGPPLRLLTGGLPAGAEYRLLVPWLQDPVQLWSPAAYRRACRLAEECDRRGIPVTNPVDRLTNATKSTFARLSAGPHNWGCRCRCLSARTGATAVPSCEPTRPLMCGGCPCGG
jgi:hypothetical protein